MRKRNFRIHMLARQFRIAPDISRVSRKACCNLEVGEIVKKGGQSGPQSCIRLHCTINVAADVAVTFAEVTLMFELPIPLAVARPATLGALAIVATLAEEELQCAVSVISCVVPSLNDPVAVNCCVPPTLTAGLAGVIAIDVSVPVLTVSAVVPFTPAAAAEMVTLPLFFPYATPDERTCAILGLEDFQLKPLKFVDVLPSLKVPVAVNLIDVLRAILGLLGVMVTDTRCAVETVKVVEPLTDSTVAMMLAVPVVKLDASPWLLIVTAAGFEEAHKADAVMSCVLLSLKVPVAVNCLAVPTAMLEFAGVTAIETKVAPLTVTLALPVTEPEMAEIVACPADNALTRPEELTEALLVAEDDQVTEVSNCVLPSSKVPVAVNC